MSSPSQQGGAQAIDWSKVQQLLQQAVAHAPQIYQAVLMLLTILNGQPQPAQATAEVKCGPDGCDDACQCLDCAVECQVHALAMVIQARGCCTPDEQP
jgi:hypothetical protein